MYFYCFSIRTFLAFSLLQAYAVAKTTLQRRWGLQTAMFGPNQMALIGHVSAFLSRIAFASKLGPSIPWPRGFNSRMGHSHMSMAIMIWENQSLNLGHISVWVVPAGKHELNNSRCKHRNLAILEGQSALRQFSSPPQVRDKFIYSTSMGRYSSISWSPLWFSGIR